MEAVLDYGIRLFRHVVSQVFGNLGQAARITALPFILFFVAAYLLVGNFIVEMFQFAEGQQGSGTELSSEQFEAEFGGEAEIMARFLRGLWLVPIGFVLFAWAAVAWHRYVLVEEYSGLVPRFSASRVLGYLWRWILIILMLILAFIPIGFVAGGLLVASGQNSSLLLNMAMSFLASWVLVRWSLILPAWAVDETMTIGESWNATKNVSGEILVPILGFAIIFPALLQIVALLPLGMITVVLSLFILWIQVLVNLALLTTLYGNLVQGRELN